jgi:hypothetical protein
MRAMKKLAGTSSALTQLSDPAQLSDPVVWKSVDRSFISLFSQGYDCSMEVARHRVEILAANGHPAVSSVYRVGEKLWAQKP